MTAVRQLIAAGDLEVGELVVNLYRVAWLRHDGDTVRFGWTSETSAQQQCLGVEQELWVERQGVPGLYAETPWPPSAVHR